MTQVHPYKGEYQIAGLIYYRREDGIDIYRFTDSSRDTVDAWAERVLQTEYAAGAKAHVRAIYDIRGQWVTAYAIRSMFRISRISAPLLASSVAVIGEGLLLSTVQIILDHLPQNPDQERRVFTSEEAAVRWLEERKTLFAGKGGQR